MEMVPVLLELPPVARQILVLVGGLGLRFEPPGQEPTLIFPEVSVSDQALDPT